MTSRPAEIRYQEATVADIPEIVRARGDDPEFGRADARMAPYLEGTHHPQQALQPRVILVGRRADEVIGYIGGHRTRRYECDGELQYLYVMPEHRRVGIASELLVQLARWFVDHDMSRVCVDVGNPVSRAFYSRHGAVELNEHWMVWPEIASLSS